MTPKSLLAAIALPASVADARTLPIIGCLRFDNGRVTGTDLERQVSAGIDIDLSCCVPVDRLTAALKSLPADCDAKLNIQDKRLRVRGGRSKFMIPTLPVDDFPAIEWVEPDTVIDDPAAVAAAIRAVEPAMADVDVRQYLKGVAVQSGALHGTNGHWASTHACTALPDGIIIPRASVPMVLAAMEEETVRCAADDRGLHIAANGYRLSTKLVEGKYPDMSRHWRAKHSPTWTCDRQSFVDAVAAVHGMRSRTSAFPPCAELCIDEGRMTLTMRYDGEEAVTDIECDGPALKEGFDLRYLLAAGRVIDGDTLTMCMPNGEHTGLYVAGGNPAQRCVVMPARI